MKYACGVSVISAASKCARHVNGLSRSLEKTIQPCAVPGETLNVTSTGLQVDQPSGQPVRTACGRGNLSSLAVIAP